MEWYHVFLLWFGSGFLGIVFMTIQAVTKGHSLLHLIKSTDLKFFLILVGCGLITLAVSSERLERDGLGK